MKKIILLYWFVLFFTLIFTRFYKLNEYPPHLTIDEVSIGYNAYSILKTGMDEWGEFMPISFRSVGDYKAPTLIYLTVPFIKFFGLNEWGVRLPVAIFSFISVLLFWYLVNKFIFKDKSSYLAYISTFIFALSPWLIVYSRSGYEAVVAQTFMLANIIFAFKLKETKKISDFFWMVIFAYLSAVTYHSTKMVVPLLNIYFVLSNKKILIESVVDWSKKEKFKLIILCTILVAITIFFVTNFIFGSGSSRAKMTFLTKDFEFARVLLPEFEKNPYSVFTSIIGFFSFWYKRYLDYFSPNFYLFSGLGLATPSYPAQGVIYAVEYLFFIIGFCGIVFKDNKLKEFFAEKYFGNFLLVWFMVGLLPASLTNNAQHSLRTLNLLPVLSIVISLGIAFIFKKIKHSTLFLCAFFAIIILGYSLGVTRFLDYYLLHYPVELSENRSFGWKQVSLYANAHHQEYQLVYVDSRFGTEGQYIYGVPYLYLLFYSQYDPLTYIQGRKTFRGTNFENYVFTDINWYGMDHSQNNLYISSPWSIPVTTSKKTNIKLYVPFLNNKSGLYVVSDQ